ncbi:MAG: hypothetical protein ACJ8EJ_20335, partial [Xanthobacteraceae bacterium]
HLGLNLVPIYNTQISKTVAWSALGGSCLFLINVLPDRQNNSLFRPTGKIQCKQLGFLRKSA